MITTLIPILVVKNFKFFYFYNNTVGFMYDMGILLGFYIGTMLTDSLLQGLFHYRVNCSIRVSQAIHS